METTPTRTPRGWVALVGLLAVFATVVAACGGGSGSSSTDNTGGAKAEPNVTIAASGPPKPGGSLTYAVEAETDGFNPSVNRWAISGFMVANAVFDPLVAYDSNYTPQPYLAKSFTPSADFTTWTIVMRDGHQVLQRPAPRRRRRQDRHGRRAQVAAHRGGRRATSPTSRSTRPTPRRWSSPWPSRGPRSRSTPHRPGRASSPPRPSSRPPVRPPPASPSAPGRSSRASGSPTTSGSAPRTRTTGARTPTATSCPTSTR